MKNIGIVCEGPTDYIVLRRIIDTISGESNQYFLLQPEDDLTGRYGNGWKGVWKWCKDHAEILEKYFREIIPRIDILIVQMDGDVARKEKEVHCLCKTVGCESQEKVNPLECSQVMEKRCPIELPCSEHEASARGNREHLTVLIDSWLMQNERVCIVIPCDSTDTWIAAAYDDLKDAEEIEDPWNTIISKKKEYHGVRIPGHRKGLRIYEQLTEQVCGRWERVKQLCTSAELFEKQIKAYLSL